MKGHKTGLEISYPCKSVSRDGSPQAQPRKVSFDSDPFLEIMYLNLGYNVKIFKRLLLYEINVLDVIMALLTLHLNVSYSSSKCGVLFHTGLKDQVSDASHFTKNEMIAEIQIDFSPCEDYRSS